MFNALRYRREVEFRHDCFVAGIVAADNRNARRGKDDKVISALDYAVGEDEIDIEREQAKQNIRMAFQMASGLKKGGMSKEESAIWRQRRVRNLMEQGYSSEDAVELMEEAFE